jgi:hypothetical protein
VPILQDFAAVSYEHFAMVINRKSPSFDNLLYVNQKNNRGSSHLVGSTLFATLIHLFHLGHAEPQASWGIPNSQESVVYASQASPVDSEKLLRYLPKQTNKVGPGRDAQIALRYRLLELASGPRPL